MKKYKLLFISIILISITTIIWFGINFAPGSYPYTEEYEINASESVLIKSIEDFKIDNPKYNVPEYLGLKDGRFSNSEHWYHIYFYYPEENQIIHTWIRPIEKQKTTFALVSVNQGLALGQWKEINHDFNNSENKTEKEKFENRILKRINESLPK